MTDITRILEQLLNGSSQPADALLAIPSVAQHLRWYLCERAHFRIDTGNADLTMRIGDVSTMKANKQLNRFP